MPRQFLRALSYALAVALLCAMPPLGAAQTPVGAANGSISLRAIRKPLREVVLDLARLTGQSLRVAPELAEQKVLIIARDQPPVALMDRIADVLGWRWVREGDQGSTRLALERDPEVAKWLAFYEQQRQLASEYARDQQAKFVRKFMDDMIRHADDPNWQPPKDIGPYDRGLAQFLNTLPGSALDAIAQQVASGTSVNAGGPFTPGAARVTFTMSELSPGQQQMLGGWLSSNAGRFGAFGSRLQQEIGQTPMALRSLDGAGIVLEFDPPDNEMPDSHMAAPIFGESYSPEKLAEFKDADLRQRLAKRDMPPGALLGSHFEADGRPMPQVTVADAVLGQKETKLPDGNPQRWQFLVGLADTYGLNLVADYYTCSDRMDLGTGPLEKLMCRGADAYHSVFVEEGGWLLGRRELWPEDDRAEIPAPLAEQWIAAKQEGRGLTFDDIARMAALAVDQLDALTVYRDGSVNFGNEVAAARGPADRPLLAAFARLSEQQKRLAHSMAGVLLTAFPRDVEIEVIRRARWQIAGVVPGMAVRVRRHSLSAKFPTPVDDLELVAPGSDAPVRLVTVFASR